MNRINITLENNLPYGSRLFADGKEIAVEKDKRGVAEIFVETEKESSEICIVNVFENQLPFWKWFLITFTCWIISLFGIFDSVSNSKGRTVDVKLQLKTSGNAFVKLKFNQYKKDAPVMQITDANTEINEISNRYYTDKRAQKRAKFYKVWRIVSIIAVAVIALFVISTRS